MKCTALKRAGNESWWNTKSKMKGKESKNPIINECQVKVLKLCLTILLYNGF